MKKNISPIIIWSVLCAISIMVLLIMFAQFNQSWQQSWQNVRQKLTSNAAKEATIIIDYGNGKIRRFKGPIQENARAWDLFQQAIAVGGLKVEITDHFIPQQIDGVKDGANGKHWSLYLNGEKQKFSPFETSVQSGDEVIFKFE